MIEYKNKRSIQNKWPAIIVVGQNVTEEQAAEIILRTDMTAPHFKYIGNDRKYSEDLEQLFSNYPNYSSLGLQYIHNNRILSSWIGGPHGWCNWDGTIGSSNYNIGKWPSIEEVAKEWEKISKEFPYLDLQCQIFTGEIMEEGSKPCILISVKNGSVVVEDSDEPIGRFIEPSITNSFGKSIDFEKGINIESLKHKLENIYNK